MKAFLGSEELRNIGQIPNSHIILDNAFIIEDKIILECIKVYKKRKDGNNNIAVYRL